MDVKEILSKHYEGYDEEGRFKRGYAHQVEPLITIHYIDKFLKPGNRILEIGAGTGFYSIYYAKKGYKVDAIELVEHNIDVFKSKITNDLDINLIQGNALDLSIYEDNTFDITLLLGPLYHLFTEKDKEKAISEAVRVTKKTGKIFIAYINHDSVILTYFVKKGNMKKMPELCDEEYRLKDDPKEIFSTFHVKDFKKMMEKFNVKLLHNVATDGVSSIMREYINNFDEEEFDLWMGYRLATCEREDLQGYSEHMLYICEKE